MRAGASARPRSAWARCVRGSPTDPDLALAPTLTRSACDRAAWLREPRSSS